VKNIEEIATSILTLGPAKIPNPIEVRVNGGGGMCLLPGEDRVLVNVFESPFVV
jgi:hypothetical protein